EPNEKYSSYFKTSDVVMPDGFEINPALGKDLGPVGCTAAEFNKADPDTANTCPAGALIGTVTAQVPVLSTPLVGNVYLGEPGPTRADRYKMLIDAHGAISAKLEGRVTVADDGRISVKLGDPSVDTYLPQFPFSDFTLTFKSGPRAVVSNPLTCGTHTGSVSIAPWSGQPAAVRPMVSNISYDGNGAPCPSSQDFDPSFSMTPSSTAAGGHSDYTFSIGRQDRQQLISQIDMSLPPGLAAAPSAAPTCSDAQANAGNCPANAAVGSLIAGIGSGPETLDLPGTLYNAEPSAGEPARFLVVVRELVGPYDLGTVVIPLDTALRDSDYGVDVTSGQIPQRLEGIPVRLRSAVVKLNATAANGPFTYAPTSCGSHTVTARIHSDQGTIATRTANFTTTGCDALAFSPTLNLSTANTTAGTPTGIEASIDMPVSPPQSTLKKVRVNLPAGYKINPAGAEGLVACSDPQAAAHDCPNASKLGDASAVSPLIASSLSGGLFAQASGSAPDGSDRYPVVLVLTGAVNLTIHGRALVDESTGDVSIEFDNLPDLAVSNFTLATTDGDRALISNPTTCGTHVATSVLTPTSGGADATPTANLQVTDCPAGGPGFAPTFAMQLSTKQSGGHPDATFSIGRAAGEQDLKSAKVSLPTGFVGSLAALPLCPQAAAVAGNCPAASKAGTLSVKVGAGDTLLELPGEVFLTEGGVGDIGALALRIPAKAGPYDLGLVNVVGRVVLRGDLGLDAIFDDIPSQVKGVPVALRTMDMTLDGDLNNGKGSFLLSNASSCAAGTVAAEFGSYGNATANAAAPYQATGCAGRAFSPSMLVSSTPNASDKTGTLPNYRFSVRLPVGDANISAVHVVLPKSVNVNIQAIGNICEQAAFEADACAAPTAMGTITLSTPLLPYTVAGTAFLVRGAPGNVLPRLGLAIGAPINLKLLGVNKFVNTDQIDSTFAGIPDLAFSDMTIDLPGGPKGLLIRTKAPTCGELHADFASHSGQTASATAEVSGTCLSASMFAKCQKPTIAASSRGARFKFSYKLASGCPSIRGLKLTLPRGTKLGKHAVARLTGRYGSAKLKSRNFKLRGKTISLRRLPSRGATTVSITATNGVIGLPTKRRLSFVTSATRSDGVTQKTTYKPASGKVR
ncbi:MAG: hypothetical protein ACRDKI_07620, partial [Solirubrobacterales bacterium]